MMDEIRELEERLAKLRQIRMDELDALLAEAKREVSEVRRLRNQYAEALGVAAGTAQPMRVVTSIAQVLQVADGAMDLAAIKAAIPGDHDIRAVRRSVRSLVARGAVTFHPKSYTYTWVEAAS